jgi:hypothetical protein
MLLALLTYVLIAMALTAILHSPIPLFSIFPVMLGLTIGVGTYLGVKIRPVVREAIESGQDPLVAFQMTLAGLWGFEAKSGERVGGGMYSVANLDPGEAVIGSVVALYARGPLRWGSGHVSVTRRRLIFNGFVLDMLGYWRAEIGYDDIESVKNGFRLQIFAFPLSVLPAIVIRTRDGRTHAFWVLFGRKWLLERLPPRVSIDSVGPS